MCSWMRQHSSMQRNGQPLKQELCLPWFLCDPCDSFPRFMMNSKASSFQAKPVHFRHHPSQLRWIQSGQLWPDQRVLLFYLLLLCQLLLLLSLMCLQCRSLRMCLVWWPTMPVACLLYINVAPSGLLPSDLDNPTGCFTVGYCTCFTNLQMISFIWACRIRLGTLSLHDRRCKPCASTMELHTQLCGWHILLQKRNVNGFIWQS